MSTTRDAGDDRPIGLYERAGAGPAIAQGAPEADTPGPVGTGERMVVLDVLRGVALLGILVVNMPFFATPGIVDPDFLTRELPGAVDRAARWLVTFLAEGKFYPLFSFLFGYGFAVQLSRDAPGSPRRRYVRRLAGLLLLGLAHVTLLWAGDILAIYAVLGSLLLLFERRAERTLLRWAGALLLVAVVPIVLLTVVTVLVGAAPEAAQADAELRRAGSEALAIAREGSFPELVRQRWNEYSSVLFVLVLQGPVVLAMFLVGMWTARRGVLHDPAAERPLLRRVLVIGLLVGLAGSFAGATLRVAADSVNSATYVASFGFLTIAGPVQALAYAAGVVLLLLRGEEWRRRLAPLARVGRLALSNYILQSLIATSIFYGYGLGLYGRVGSALLLALSVAIFALQVLLSGWWLRHLRFGPLEWLLRSFTYWRRQPMRGGGG